MHERTKKMHGDSMQLRKGYTFCIVCGASGTVAAHLLGRNVYYPRYKPDDRANIRPLCHQCHTSYDKRTKPKYRIQWWRDRGFEIIAQRIEWLVSNE